MAKPTQLTVVGDSTLLILNPALLALPWAAPAIRGHPTGALGIFWFSHALNPEPQEQPDRLTGELDLGASGNLWVP